MVTCCAGGFLELALDGLDLAEAVLVSLEAADFLVFEEVLAVGAEGFEEVRERVACGDSFDSCDELWSDVLSDDFSAAGAFLEAVVKVFAVAAAAAAGAGAGFSTCFAGGAAYCSRIRFFRADTRGGGGGTEGSPPGADVTKPSCGCAAEAGSLVVSETDSEGRRSGAPGSPPGAEAGAAVSETPVPKLRVSPASAAAPSGFSSSESRSDEEDATRGCEARSAGETFSSFCSDEDEALEWCFCAAASLRPRDDSFFTLPTVSRVGVEAVASFSTI